MRYNFDESIDRSGTFSVKTDALKPRYGDDKLIPLWVADMDFKAAPEIVNALKDRVQHGVFGYTISSEPYYRSIRNWLSNLYSWEVSTEEISYVPGIVKGIAFAIDCFTDVEDKIIIQPPVYHPFDSVPKAFKRKVVENPLKYKDGAYTMDLEHFRSLAEDSDCKMFILSNPHNPGGMIWSKETLSALAKICSDNNILVLSDEIHSEIIHQGYKHTPFATVSPQAMNCCITFMAPSKTFNLAGLISSYAIVKNKEIRNRYFNFLKRAELNQGSIFSYLSTEVAYTQCNEWRLQMIDYIWENILYIDSFLKTEIPRIKAILPQASFLVWLDCTDLNLNHEELNNLFVKKAGLALNDGEMFGTGGKGFMRLNVGCPRAVLQQAMKQLKEAIEN